MPAFRQRNLCRLGDEDAFEGRCVVFEGPEDYRRRINDPALAIDAAEVVNMQPPDALIRAGVSELPCIGDGRQSGTSGSSSISNASPAAAAGGGLALLRTGDPIRIDLRAGTADALVDPAEWAARRAAWRPPDLPNQTPWQEIHRANVGPLARPAAASRSPPPAWT
jgi:dihydroxy-acid dehydratase